MAYRAGMNGTTPSAGWYADAQVPGGERYWDGQEWTAQRRDGAGRVPPPPIMAPPTKTTAAVSWVVRVVGGILVAVVAVAIINVVLGFVRGTSVDGDSMELDIDIALMNRGVDGADINCSSIDHVEQGDVAICEGKDGAGHPISVKVTFNSDGSYVWQLQ